MPFISRGKTLGFKRIDKLFPLEALLREMAKKGFIGRIVFDGVHPKHGKVLLRIEMSGEKVVALEAEVGGKLLQGPEAVPIFEDCLKEGEGFAEIIQLDDNKLMIDLDNNPQAVVSIMITTVEAEYKLRSLHATGKGSLSLLGELLANLSFVECLVVEGKIDSGCDGVIKGEICSDKADMFIFTKDKELRITSTEDLKPTFNVLSESCSMAELILKRKE